MSPKNSERVMASGNMRNEDDGGEEREGFQEICCRLVNAPAMPFSGGITSSRLLAVQRYPY